MATDNPAWRLQRILERALTAPNGILRDLWATAFDIRRDETALLFRRLAEMHRLVDEVESAVRSIPAIDHDYYLQNLSALRSAISVVNLERQANDAVSLIHGYLMRDIGFWARHLDQMGFNVIISDEEIKALLADLDKIMDEVRSAQIDDDLRAVVLDGLEGVRRAISEFWLHGTAGLREEVDRAIGRLARYAPDLKQHAKDGWFAHVFVMLARIDSVVERGKKYLPLVKPVARLLGFDVELPPLLE